MKSTANSRRVQRGSLRHIRRNVLLLLGAHAHALHTGIARYAREAAWIVDSTYTSRGVVPDWWRGDGILALITTPKDALAQRRFPNVPLVDFSKGWIASTMPERFRADGFMRPRVLYDNLAIGRIAAEHFVERGLKHIVFLNGGNYWMEQERLPSFRAIVEAAGSQFFELEYYRQLPKAGGRYYLIDHPSAHGWLVQSLLKLPRPFGIWAAADYIALRVMRACDDAGLSVPDEVAILGCHNDPLICDYAPVPLSSVDDDMERIGYEGAKLLDQIMDGERVPREPIMIPPKGIATRLSTSVLAVEDPNIARAIRFIYEHFHENLIGPEEVAAAAGLSRSALDRAFGKFFGRSPAQKLLHMRIEHAKRLLLETGMKAHEIAFRAGFSNTVHFSQAFHRVMGKRPSSFRNRKAPDPLALPRFGGQGAWKCVS
jgi:LacI family transcriptional regulator